jgi:hypothetical protein
MTMTGAEGKAMKKRLCATFLTACLVLVVGCGKSYSDRMERTLDRLREQQRFDQFLITAPQDGKFKELKIFVRPPKPMEISKTFGLTEEPGRYDLTETFLAIPKADPQAKEGTPPPDPNAVFRLHVLARLKKTKKAATKKGVPPPPEPAVPRGEFTADVRTLLATDTGGGETALTAALKNDSKKPNQYKRLIFPASNSDVIKVYFYKQGDYDVALVWDIPPGQDKPTATGVELCLKSFAVGRKAELAFAGESDEEGGGPAASEGGTAAPGAAF